jgi:hypothetical protein
VCSTTAVRKTQTQSTLDAATKISSGGTRISVCVCVCVKARWMLLLKYLRVVLLEYLALGTKISDELDKQACLYAAD